MTRAEKYHEALAAWPDPGCGRHGHLQRVSNLGVLAGMDPERIREDILRTLPQGGRRIGIREIDVPIEKAVRDISSGNWTPMPRPEPVVRDGKKALENLIRQGKFSDEADLWDASPIGLRGEPADDTVLFLISRYRPDDLLFIGERYDEGVLGETIRTRDEWISFFRTGGKTAPLIICNPLTGDSAPTKGDPDKKTYRGDANIKNFSYCIIEFDNLPRENQIKFWSAARLPICALVDSGGKSIHAWLQLKGIDSADAWEREIKIELYDKTLIPMGVDAACSNPSRLSRLPGHFRLEKNNYQRLLWLSQEGRRVYQ